MKHVARLILALTATGILLLLPVNWNFVASYVGCLVTAGLVVWAANNWRA